MNALIQQESALIGSEKAIASLETRNSARLLVLSDSHGDLDTVRSIIMQFGTESDAMIFCGDGFCDIAACLEEAARDEKLKEALPPVIAAVRGNGDADSYLLHNGEENQDEEAALCKILAPPRLELTAAGRNILAVHGHRHGVDWGTETLLSSARTMDADMVFFGHTHCVHREEEGGTLILNPGSCSSPRDRLPPAFATVSFPGGRERFKVEFFGIYRGLFGSTDIRPLPV